jgi:hypothetical protein
MAVMPWRPFGHGLEPWVGTRDLGDIQSKVNRLLDTFFNCSARATARAY